MLTGTLIISYDLQPCAASAVAVLQVLTSLPAQAFPLVICGFDRATCLALGAELSDVCYNMYDFLPCTPEVLQQTDTLPYLMLVQGGKIRQLRQQNSALQAHACATLNVVDIKEANHAPYLCPQTYSAGR